MGMTVHVRTRNFGREGPAIAPPQDEPYAHLRKRERLRFTRIFEKSGPPPRILGKLPYGIHDAARLCIQDIGWRGATYG
jgi:hypothetical protein